MTPQMYVLKMPHVFDLFSYFKKKSINNLAFYFEFKNKLLTLCS